MAVGRDDGGRPGSRDGCLKGFVIPEWIGLGLGWCLFCVLRRMLCRGPCGCDAMLVVMRGRNVALHGPEMVIGSQVK